MFNERPPSAFEDCRVTSWLASTIPDSSVIISTLESDHESASVTRKRKRAMSLPISAPTSTSHYSDISKRRRTDDPDDIYPEQSASQVGREVLDLKKKNTFTPPVSRISAIGRTSSPTRETPIILTSAWPPVLTESLNGLKDAPPKQVDTLGDRLADSIDFVFIPIGLKHTIEHDTDVGHQAIKPADFDYNDSRTTEELTTLWKGVKRIFLNARDCKDGSRDENAWCNDVLQPLIQVAIDLYGQDRWWLQSVQSQLINPLYLSTIPAPTSIDPGRRKPIDRKTDFVLSYSHRNPEIASLYRKLGTADHIIGHTLDAFTQRTALFSGFEVKAASGNHTEAELQMSIWMAASLRKKQELIQKAHAESASAPLVEPALTVVGHEHSVYYAFLSESLVSGRNGVHVLGPDGDRFERLNTDSLRGIFRLLRFYGNLLEYGMDDRIDGYWGGTLKPALEQLAAICPGPLD